MIQRLVATGYLEVESEHSTLRLLPPSYPVLKGQATVMLSLPKEPEERKPAEEADGLFDALRSVRRRLAEKENVPAFVVFSDATLRDMCRLQPQTLDEMSEVKGVGERKLRRYGEDFLAVIRDNRKKLK